MQRGLKFYMSYSFNCVIPSRADASFPLDLDNPFDQPLCSPTLVALNTLILNFFRMATLAINLVFQLCLLLAPVWVVFTGVRAFLNWAERHREKLEMQEEEDCLDIADSGPVPQDTWGFAWRERNDDEMDDSSSVASNESYDANRSLSPTPVPEMSEELQELHRRNAKLNELRDGFEQVYPDIGPRIYGERRYQAYRNERAAVNKAFRDLRRAQSPQADQVPGRLRREGAVTRSAFLNGDTRPREECFDSDEETACGDDQ